MGPKLVSVTSLHCTYTHVVFITLVFGFSILKSRSSKSVKADQSFALDFIFASVASIELKVGSPYFIKKVTGDEGRIQPLTSVTLGLLTQWGFAAELYIATFSHVGESAQSREHFSFHSAVLMKKSSSFWSSVSPSLLNMLERRTRVSFAAGRVASLHVGILFLTGRNLPHP